MSEAVRYIREIQEGGRFHFTSEEAARFLGVERRPLARAFRRLVLRGDLASPHRGFYVVVPPEYRALGCLPPEQFIPQLMESLDEPYHAGLLSAAQFHGAAHQRPQRFQVMVAKPRVAIHCGKVFVEFHVRKELERVATIAMKTPRGLVRVSSVEATVLELVGYAKHAGGLDNVATVIAEMAESIVPERLIEEAAKSPVAWSQRLGLLAEMAGAREVADTLLPFVQKHARRATPLNASFSRSGAARSGRWQVAINAEVQADL